MIFIIHNIICLFQYHYGVQNNDYNSRNDNYYYWIPIAVMIIIPLSISHQSY